MAATTYIIKQLGIESVGKFFAVFGLVWGFFGGLIFAAGVTTMGAGMGVAPVGFMGGLVALGLSTIIGGVCGFIGGAIIAILYNIVLGATGGIEMDLEVKA
ncbi:MAG: hypothetical protein M0R30_09540 [Methanoregula sp.]|jgi:hypothetical protein|uniref:hypothetical protein n=1 Tax=Methanoregula sp. TaxID=2052170 RepID=UPI0025E0E47C|nr:hypothetical protein [Methanoregula sp.]MCK9631874.1 hypothetical protein [Methanoregula sp.]